MTKETPGAKFGREVRRRRDARGMTLETLAEQSGLTPNYIGSVELGKRDPSLSTVCAIASALGVRPAELFGVVANVSPTAGEAGLIFDAAGPEIQAPIMALLRFMAQRPRT